MKLTKHEMERRRAIVDFKAGTVKLADENDLSDTELVAALTEILHNITSRQLTDELRAEER